jgi:hypothetical protein
MSDYYVSTTGTGVGSYADPWPWKDAITGVKTVLPGDRILFKAGTYTDKKAGTPWDKSVTISGLAGTALAPIHVMAAAGEHAILDLFLDVNSGAAGSAYVFIHDLHIKDLDAKIDPATISGGSAPAELADWGTGIYLGDAPTCKAYNNVLEGGGLSAFQSADNAEFYGNVVFDYGWRSTADRAHGHGIYAANRASDGQKIIKRNIFGPGYYGKQYKGHYAVHLFSTNEWLEDINASENVVFGPLLARTESNTADDVVLDGNWISSIHVGTTAGLDGDGVSAGDANLTTFATVFATDANQLDMTGHPFSNDEKVEVFTSGTLPAGLTAATTYYVVNSTTNAIELSATIGGAAVTLTSDGSGTHTSAKLDETGTFTNTTLINSVVRVVNNRWESLTMTGVRIFKSVATWWSADEGTTPALFFNESATFSDVSGGGTDESELFANIYDSDRANLVIADLDGDGSVDVGATVGAFLSTGDSYTVHHFRSVYGASVASGTWTGALTLDVVETLGLDGVEETGAMDAFVVFRVVAATTGSSGGTTSAQREMSAGMLAATQADTVAPILMYSASFPDVEVYGWTGYGTMSWNNQTWTGYGDLIMIDPVQESTDSAADSLAFTMSGLAGEYYTAVMLGDYHGMPATVYVAALDLITGQLVDDPYLLFAGVLDSDVIKDDGASATLRMTLINDVSDQLRARSWQYTHEDQQSLYPGVVDDGLEFVAALQDVEIG